MNAEEATLWNEYVDTTSVKSLHALINFYQEWLIKLTKTFYVKYYTSVYEYADYLHWGTVALIESIKRFNDVGSAKFETYAYKRIQGEIINHVNKATESIAQHKFLKSHFFEDRVIALTEVSEKSSNFEVLCNVTLSLMVGNMLEDEFFSNPDEECLLNEIYGRRLNTQLTDLMLRLPPQEKEVLIFHYLYRYRFAEISEQLGISKGRVSQLHSSGLETLRKIITESEVALSL